MNNQQTVINAAKQHSPKHASKFENAILDSRSYDIPVLANLVTIVCQENSIHMMSNPFPAGCDQHDDWAACTGEGATVAAQAGPVEAGSPFKGIGTMEEPQAETEQPQDPEPNPTDGDDAPTDSEPTPEPIGVPSQPGTPETDADPGNPSADAPLQPEGEEAPGQVEPQPGAAPAGDPAKEVAAPVNEPAMDALAEAQDATEQPMAPNTDDTEVETITSADVATVSAEDIVGAEQEQLAEQPADTESENQGDVSTGAPADDQPDSTPDAAAAS